MSYLQSFQSFYQQLSSICPYIVSSPLYFSGAIDMGGLMQIGYAFGEVNGALNWFIDSYTNLTEYHASISRLMELEHAFQKNAVEQQSQQIIISNAHEQQLLMIQALQVKPTSEAAPIFKNLNMTINPGEKVLLKGQSGLGKFTIFKAISGTWKFGEGSIQLPQITQVAVMPQQPSIPSDDLKSIVCYPNFASNYSDEQVSNVLKMVHLQDFIEQLHREDTLWSNGLSGGQKQRISFARMILQNPDLILMDEVTASLDEESENQLYTLMLNLFSAKTFIGIAHRSTVDKHHDRIIQLEKDQEGNIHLH